MTEDLDPPQKNIIKTRGRAAESQARCRVPSLLSPPEEHNLDATGTPDPISMTPKTCGKPSKDNQCSSAASFYPVPLPLGLLPPLVARSALGGRHPTGAKTPPAPFPPISALPPPHFPAVVFLPGTALLLPISMPSPLARSEGAAGASGAPGRRARRRGDTAPLSQHGVAQAGSVLPMKSPYRFFCFPARVGGEMPSPQA